MTSDNSKPSIAQWHEADRPREKLLHKGLESLSDAELVAILIGSGSMDQSAVDLSKSILQSVDYNLYELGKREVNELCAFKGIGEAKAVSIVAALELGRRRNQHAAQDRTKIGGSQDVFAYFSTKLSDINHEEFHVLYLNRANKILSSEAIGKGGRSAVAVDVKLVFEKALSSKACAIILCHNHPSGNLEPSRQDRQLTEKVVAAGKVLDIAVLDHLIIAGRTYLSFQDENLMPT